MYQSRIRNAKSRNNRNEKARGLEMPDAGQEYGLATQLLGNGRLMVLCSDGVQRMGRICGSMRKYNNKVLVDAGNLLLISHRGFEDKVDVLGKYTYEETLYLAQYDNFPEVIRKAMNHVDGADDADNADDAIEFADGDSDIDLSAI
jgi:translation initiation factor 1A